MPIQKAAAQQGGRRASVDLRTEHLGFRREGVFSASQRL